MQSPEGAKESIGPRIVSVAPLGLWTGAIDSGPLRARPNPGRPFGPKQRNIRLLRAVVLITLWLRPAATPACCVRLHLPAGRQSVGRACLPAEMLCPKLVGTCLCPASGRQVPAGRSMPTLHTGAWRHNGCRAATEDAPARLARSEAAVSWYALRAIHSADDYVEVVEGVSGDGYPESAKDEQPSQVSPRTSSVEKISPRKRF